MVSSAVGFFYFLAAVTIVRGDHVHEMVIAKGPTKFSWNNCKTSTPLSLNFTALSLTPDPIHLGSDAQLSLTAKANENIGTTDTLQIDVDANLDMSGTKIDVCDFVPYCHFKDFCSVMKEYKNKCPDVLKKLVPKCQCPLKKGEYTVTKATVPLPSAPIPVKGELTVKVKLTEAGKQIGCLEMTILVD